MDVYYLFCAWSALPQCTVQNPYTAFLIDDPITGNLKFVGEECMAFGPLKQSVSSTCTSQVGQRAANHLIQMFRLEMDKIDTGITLEEADKCPKLKKWLEERYVDSMLMENGLRSIDYIFPLCTRMTPF